MGIVGGSRGPAVERAVWVVVLIFFPHLCGGSAVMRTVGGEGRFSDMFLFELRKLNKLSEGNERRIVRRREVGRCLARLNS